MCVGIPMRILSVTDLSAVCESGDGRQETIDLALVGSQQPGTWLLTFLGAARDVIDEETAALITRALDGLSAAMRGEGVGDAFSDLENREPQLPPHLEAARRAGLSTA